VGRWECHVARYSPQTAGSEEFTKCLTLRHDRQCTQQAFKASRGADPTSPVIRDDLPSRHFPSLSLQELIKSMAITRSSKQAHSGDDITLQNMDQINADIRHKNYSLTDGYLPSHGLQRQPFSNRLGKLKRKKIDSNLTKCCMYQKAPFHGCLSKAVSVLLG